MSGAHEVAEHIEHAAHGEKGHGHGGGVGRMAGITMAILGVLLALCAALVGGARTDLIATMVAQSNTYQKYQAQRMKHRMMITQLASLHALSPSHAELKKFEDDLAAQAKTAKGESASAEEIRASIETSTRSLVEILSPRKGDEQKLVDATKRYGAELDAAEAWAEAYDEAVETHEKAAERFEWAQLAAEIGIVIASVALLLANKKAWWVSVAFGTACVGILGATWVSSRQHTSHAEAAIAHAKSTYTALRSGAGHEDDDEEILDEIERKIQQAPPGAAHAQHP